MADLLTQGRLRHAELFGGAAKVESFGHRQEVAQMAKLIRSFIRFGLSIDDSDIGHMPLVAVW